MELSQKLAITEKERDQLQQKVIGTNIIFSSKIFLIKRERSKEEHKINEH